jgi:CubicO group peptidase (beta-lactamase class C family)
MIAALALSFHSLQAQTLDARIDGYVQHRPGAAFNGVILVAHNGSVVFNRAYGFADADLGVANRTDLRFGIGSLTKPLTATAVLRLVERDKLSLDDAICKYLRQCPSAWRGGTIEHLLSHTSGVPDLFNELPAAPVDSTRAVIDAAIVRHLADPLRSQPGERYVYNNFGYFLVAYAIEVVTGELWESVLRDEVFTPAGMHDTEYDDVWRVMRRRARGYVQDDDSLRHIRYRDHSAYAAGGLLSSAADLLRFDAALWDGRLLADSTRQWMFTVRQGDYSLGWQVTTAFGRRLLNHTGGTNGFSSWLGHFDGGLTVIVLRNVEGAATAKTTGCDVAAIALDLQPSPREDGPAPCRERP